MIRQRGSEKEGSSTGPGSSDPDPRPAHRGSGKLEGVLAGVRGYLSRRACGAALLAVAAVVGVILLLAWLLAGVEGWRAGSPLPLVLVLVGAATAGALVAWVWRRLESWTGEGALTGEVERSADLPDGMVRAQLELGRSLPPGVSGSLVGAGERSLLPRLDAAPGRLAGRWGEEAGRLLRLGVAGVVGVALLVALAALLSPERSRAAWAGIVRPVGILMPEPLPPLTLEPGDAQFARGSEPSIRVGAPGRDSVTLHWQPVGEIPSERTLAVSEGSAATTLPPLDAELSYWATAPDGASSERHRLEPTDPSLLTDLTVEVAYPSYTRLPTETFRGAPPSLRLPEGTVLRIRGRVEGEGSAVRLDDEGGRTLLRSPIQEGAFAGTWRPVRSTRAEWTVEDGDEGGFPPPPFDVELIADRPPEVSLPVPGGDGDLPASLRLPLLLEATDDWGVAWVEIEVTAVTAEGREEPVVERIETGDRPRVSVRPVLDVSEWGLAPGSRIRLRARAADNALVPAISETPVYELRVPSSTEVRDGARDRIDEGADRVSDLAERALADQRELAELARRAGAERAAAEGFQEREELRSAAERQAELARELEELRAGLEEAREALGETQEDRSLAERLRELERLLDEAVGPEMRERLRELLDSLERGEPMDISAAVDELQQAQSDMRDRLEEVLERLQRAALEESYQGMEEEARALAEAQDEMGDRLRDGEDAAAQEELAQRAEAARERMEQLAERLERAGEPEAGERVREAGSDLERSREAMERAAEAARAGETGEAGEEADQAAEDARRALDEIEQARMEWLEEWEERIREALRRGAQDALALARRQAEVRDEIQGAGVTRRALLQGEETALAQGLRNLATQLGLATRQAPGVGREISIHLGAALEAVERTVEGLRTAASGPRTTPYAAAGEAHLAMNRVALAALQGMEQLGQEAGGQSTEELLEELESLASQQGAVNDETAAMSQQDPDADGAAGPGAQELAALQEAIGEAMRELAQRPGSEELMGDLEAMAREAAELAAELEERRLTPETLSRQEQLLERLLTAGRTLERDGPTEEREGTPAGPVERRAISPLPEAVLRGLALPLPTVGELEALTPAERRLVLEYFDRVNRRRAGSASGSGVPR